MALDNEYRTSNRKIRYPFSDDSVLYKSEETSSESSGSSYSYVKLQDDLSITVFGCFIDANIQYKSHTADTVPHIKGISLDGHTLYFTLSDESSNNNVYLTCTRSTKTYSVIQGECAWCWYVFVISSSGIREYEDKKNLIGDISISELNLNVRCVGKSALAVSELWIYGGERRNDDGSLLTRQEAMLQSPDTVLTGDITFNPGYNMKYSQEDEGFAINAIPGAGLGLAPCGCDDTKTEFKTPGLLSKDGHSRIFNDTCYDIVPILESESYGVLQMHVKCKACCTCSMYESIVNNKLIPLRDKIIQNRKKINDVYEVYEENVTKWNKRLASALPKDIVITSTGVALDAAATDLSGTGITGKMNRCGFSLMMRNDSFVDITFKIEEFEANGKTFESQISYMDADMNPVILPVDLWSSKEPIVSVTIKPGRSATLTYFVRLAKMVSTDSQSGFLARTKVTAYSGNQLIDTRYEVMSI